jgi:DNA-directed RNA polymerase specialized sigma24 family protein
MLNAAGGPSRSSRTGSRRGRDTVAVRRARVAWALRNADHDRRVVLALLLVERLSAVEAASALGVPVERVRGSYRQALAELRAAAHGAPRPRGRRPRTTHVRFRKAS